jgi:HEAT repeat protein
VEQLWRREAELIKDAGLRGRFLQTLDGTICGNDVDLAEAIKKVTRAKEPLLRAEGLFFIKYFGIEVASKAWSSALTDPSADVRVEALAAISYLHDDREARRVEGLATSDPDPWVREYAERVLRSLRKLDG